MSTHERLIDMEAAMQLGPVPYLLEPLIPEGVVVTVTGIRGDSKTWLAMAACAAIERGGGLAGMQSSPAPALLVDGESGARILGQRFRLLGLAPDAFHVADGFGLRLPHDVRVVRELIAATSARIVVLDSLRRLAPGVRENDSDDIAPLYAELAELSRELGCTVVVLHHRSVKPGAPDSRGSTAIEDQSDVCFVLERVPEDPQAQTRRRLRNTKNRIAAELPPMWLDFYVTGGVMTVGQTTPYGVGEEGAKRRPARSELAPLILALLGGFRRGCKVQPPYRGLALCTLAEIAGELGRDPKDGSLRNALRDLGDHGLVERDDDRRWSLTPAGWDAAEENAPARNGNGYRPVDVNGSGDPDAALRALAEIDFEEDA